MPRQNSIRGHFKPNSHTYGQSCEEFRVGMSIAKPRRQNEDPDRRTEANWRAHFRQGSSSTQTIDVPRVRLGSQIVSMMQPAEPWHGYNSATCRRVHFRLTTLRRSLRQRQVRSIFVVIPNTLVRQTFQVTLIERLRDRADPCDSCQPNAQQHRSATYF